ncbi:MAG: EamA family transporter [Acidimicrobiia bacterium]|nr:EamA family transporter [Acidimicrobiia bacterium]
MGAPAIVPPGSPPPRRGFDRGLAGRLPAPAYFVAGAVSQYLGAALAVTLFDALGASAVAWLRVASSGVVLWLLRGRPRWAGLAPRSRSMVVAFGAALAAMNLTYYLAIERLPLGTATAIEFSGPISVAALASRTPRAWAALAAAVAGVLLLAEVRWQASPDGVAFALGAAALWAGYIVLGQRVAGAAPNLDALAWSMLVGSLVIAPFGAVGVAAHVDALTLAVLGGCVLVGLASNVVPYTLDQVVLARLDRGQFALLLALLPATATAIGVVVLAERPSLAELAGIGLVILAVGVRPRR